MDTPDSVPGLFYVPDWLTDNAQSALLEMIDAAEWSEELRRRVQHYGHRYDYGRRTVTTVSAAASAPALPEWAKLYAQRLVDEGFMAREADQAIVNEYVPGQGISAHVDCVPCFGPVVAAVSLGSACVMDFANPEDGTTVGVFLEPGSLCVMTGPARYVWRHSISARKTDPKGSSRVERRRRISVTYRTIADAA